MYYFMSIFRYQNPDKMKIYLLLLLFYLSQFNSIYAQQVEKEELVIGEVLTFDSDFLKEKRTLNIYLPESYFSDTIKNYPVIYLLDGTITEDFLHIVGIVQFGSYPWINMIPESIVVGIANIDRKRDFTFPTTVEEHKKEFPTTGGSEMFIQCLEKEIQPIIAKNYRTTNEKTIIGQSLGGLLATEILLTKPSLFDNYIIISPSLWWNNESLLQKAMLQYNTPKSVYIAVGKEGKIMESEAKAIYKKLAENRDDYKKLYFNYFGDQDHANILHLAVYDAFMKLFSTKEKH